MESLSDAFLSGFTNFRWVAIEGESDDVPAQWGPIFKLDGASLTADDGEGKW